MAGEWDVVEEKPVSEWDVVSTEPAAAPPRTGAMAIPTAGEAQGQAYQPPAPREADTRSAPRRGLAEIQGALETVSTVLSALPTSLVGMAAEAFAGPAAGKRVMEAGTYVPRTPEGQRNVEAIGKATEGLPAFIPTIGPISGVAASLSKPGMRRGLEVAGERAARVADVAVPTMDPAKVGIAKKAVDAGIPLAPHMLTDNKFARLAGEAAEKVPLAGGKAKQRQEAFNAGLAKAIDPDSTDTKLTPEVFAALQDKAGSTIGEISARTPVPKDAFGDLTAVARRETPDVQQVIQTYADDFAKVADENGGIIPGDTLRRLRTEAQQQARSTTNGDLRRTLGDFVKRVDDALSEHAAPGDMDALLDARRRYAISLTLEPLVAKTTTGDISPASLMSRVTADKAGKRRMARGKGGDLGDYARIGQQFLKEQATSNTSERNLVYKVFTDAVAAGKAATAYPAAAAYNLLGPRAARWIVERNARKMQTPEPDAPAGPPPEPTLGRGFEDVPPRGGGAPASPLGDLTPDWETTPGAGGERPPAMTADGLVPAVDDPAVTTGRRKDLRAGLEIPAVEGRPDLPDALVTGAPAESAATPRANEAMMDPGAIEARRQQVDAAAARERAEPVPVGKATEITPEVVEPGVPAPQDARLVEIDRLKAATQSDVVRAALDKRAAAVQKDIKAKAAAEKKAADAAELRAAAEQTTDPEIKKALLAEADKLAKPEKIPAGEATEITPEVIEPGVPNAKNEGANGPRSKADEDQRQQAGPDGAAAPAAQRAQADEGRPGAGEGEVDGRGLRTNDLQPEGRQEGIQADGGAGAQAGKAAGEEGQTYLSPGDFNDSQTKTPEFKKWFGDSKVVDKDGKPLVVYHGSDATFDAFDKKQMKEGRWGKRFYFTDSTEKAKAYGKNVVPVYLRITGDDGLVVGQPGNRTFMVNEPTQIKSAIGNSGKFDPADPNIHMSADFPEISEAFMREQQRVQEVVKPSPPMSDRGLAAVRKTLEDGVAAGKLDKDGVALALWALDRNPNLAKGLKQEGLQVEIAPHKGARGAYNDARELIRLVENNTDGLTAAHEILHHAERMMPPKMQAGIRREWRRAVEAEIRNVAPLNPARADGLKLALRAMEDGDASAAEAMKPYFRMKALDPDKDYQLVNPTEYWAVNASEILHGRFSGRGSWRAEAVRWIKELVEHLKNTVGLRSDAPILKALDEILNPAKTTGERKSKNMITGSGRRDQPAQPQAP